jgi:hypothetical protein
MHTSMQQFVHKVEQLWAYLRCELRSLDRAALTSDVRLGTAASAAASTLRLAISSWWMALAAVAARRDARASSIAVVSK